MVSLRRRRLLGLCSGLPNSSVVPFPMYFDDEGVAQFGTSPANPVNALPMASADKMKQTEEVSFASSSMVGSSSSMQRSTQANAHASSLSRKLHDQPSPGSSFRITNDKGVAQEAKLRRRYRRKHSHEQERCALRGVYFKNMKWQAAIKVDKRQIHLGTVGSQEEAARLYDRAAFMCGREPNYELPEEDKRELKRLEWDEFLERTRLEIISKKTRRRRSGAESQDNSELRAQGFRDETGRGAEGALGGVASEVGELEEAMF